jgi:outer membrane protein assembly factor BamB
LFINPAYLFLIYVREDGVIGFKRYFILSAPFLGRQELVSLKRAKWRIGRISLLMIMLLAIGLAGFGCVRGLQPIGWSGGVVSDGTLYVGSKEGRLVAVNLADESRQWAEPLKASKQAGGFGCAPAYGGGCGGGASGVAIYGTPVVSGELVYIGGYNGKIYAYVSDTLSVRWVYPREGNLEPIVGGLLVAKGKVYFGSSDGKVYALDAPTGDKLWEFPTGDKVWSTPAISDDTLFIGSFDNKLYALSAADGSKKWDFPTEGAVISIPLLHNGTVYFGSFDRHLYAVNANDGSLRWKFTSENWFWAKPVVYDNTIYAGCLDDKVYALKADTGAKVAQFDLKSPVSSSPVVVNSSIVFASRKGMVYAVDTSANKLGQLAEIGEEVYGPLCVSEGIVYIHTQDLTLHRVNAINGAVLRPISLESKD